MDLRTRAEAALRACGATVPSGSGINARSPITGTTLFSLGATSAADVDRAIGEAHAAFQEWRSVPAPVRGQLVKHFGRLLEQHKEDLADLVTIEVGKIRSEALGEIQEMIDICEFAVGLSRQLEGRTMPSERPGHRLMETWHPRGVVGVISAFNFPAAVWAWNTAVALVCGDSVVWKPSELTPLTSIACGAILDRAITDCGAPAGVSRVILPTRDDAQRIVDDPRVALVSATGSERMGAPVMAFCRIDDKEIRLREPVLTPDALIIQDPTLLHQVDLFRGLAPDGFILINSTRTFDELGIGEFVRNFNHRHLCTVPATDLALKHVGRAVPNAALLGCCDVIIATGSDPFVPPGIETDGRTVFTSDEAVSLEWLPRWMAIIGSGYIGLEFADVYTALGCEVTMIEALDRVMPTFDPDIAKIAARHLIDGRDIDARSGVLAKSIKPGAPVQIELVDMQTREPVETLEVDAVLVATGREIGRAHV